ncbi:MAG TPA: cytochrome ubiquinol oxidase subunit I, partial [Polyangia bacterium]|nr:cytochrome ubiquinol oxidase subunit I [Polyangia bacterium]
DIMIFSASALALLSVWFIFAWWRRRDLPATRWFLRACAAAGALSLVTMEAGWITTEVGRQPWVVYGLLRTSQAVTHASGVWGSFAIVVAIYAAVGTGLVLVLRGMSRRWRGGEGEALPGPYAPRGPIVLPAPAAISSPAAAAGRAP